MNQNVSDDIIIRVEDLTVAYEDKPVLWDVELDIKKGVLMAIVGPNGAGKSTLIKAMLDLLKPVTGEVRFYNEKYSKEAATVLRFILDSGNFGYYDKRAQTNSKNKIVQKMVALNGHLKMQIRNFKMFPQESVYNIPAFFKDGFERFFEGLNKHKRSGK